MQRAVICPVPVAACNCMTCRNPAAHVQTLVQSRGWHRAPLAVLKVNLRWGPPLNPGGKPGVLSGWNLWAGPPLVLSHTLSREGTRVGGAWVGTEQRVRGKKREETDEVSFGESCLLSFNFQWVILSTCVYPHTQHVVSCVHSNTGLPRWHSGKESAC